MNPQVQVISKHVKDWVPESLGSKQQYMIGWCVLFVFFNITPVFAPALFFKNLIIR